MIVSCEGGPPSGQNQFPTNWNLISIIIMMSQSSLSFFCRKAKLSTTERVIQDIDQSDRLQNYYTINSQPGQKANSSNIISRILEKISKK